MTNAKRKSKFIFVFILLTVSILLVFSFSHRPVNAEISVQPATEISSEYAFGDKFIIPDCTFSVSGQTAKGKPSLEYPDGTQTTDKENTLNQSGKYVLRYVSTVGGKTYTKEYGFCVYGKLASYNNDKTSIEYGLCTHLGASSTGLNVRIANGDALTFDHVFDMTKVTCSTPLLEGFIVPDVLGTADFTKMVFTFTDVEDPSVQLVYHGNFHNDVNAYGLTWFTAAGNGQIHCGLEHVGKLHKGETLGCLVPHSFISMDTGLFYGNFPINPETGTPDKPLPTTPDDKKFVISYDYKNNQAWAGGKIISDLDDSYYYNTLWFGFPSGKAKLTISALNYNNATANMCFTSILGVDLSAENFVDDKVPEITVDCDYEKMPDAPIGANYPIPSASAIDEVCGIREVNVSVWYEYKSDSQKMVSIDNNRFKITDVGNYAIVYESTDYSGNVGRKVLWVKAKPQYLIPKLTVTIDESYEKTVNLGTPTALPKVVVSGGSGENSVSYTLTKGNAICEITNGKFILEESGVWTITCKATDFVGNTTIATVDIEGVASNNPIITEEPELPIAYISGSSYTLPTLYAIDYFSGEKQEFLCDVAIEYKGQTVNYKAGDSFVPTVENHKDSVKITYSCNGTKLYETEIPVFIVFSKEKISGNTDRYREVVDVVKYFYAKEGVTFTDDYLLNGISGIKITADGTSENVKTTFANPQMAETLSLDFLSVPIYSKFSKMNVVLVDSLNADISVKVSLIKDDGQTTVKVGDTTITLLLDFDGSNAVAYNVGYKNKEVLINSSALAVTKTERGEVFNGFPSGKVYFSIEMEGVENDASVFINKISNINVTNNQDNTGPFIRAESVIEKNSFKDTVYTVQKVLAVDVLCPNVETYLTVVAPDGTIVKSVDGKLLDNVDATVDYQVNLSSYGDYYVSVRATEAEYWKYSNDSYFDYTVSVADGEKPTIKFNGDFKKEIKKGELLVIPEFEVADNSTKAEDITVLIMIINPKGMPIYLYGETNAVRCEYMGVYQVYIYVYDEIGNLTVFETGVTVR